MIDIVELHSTMQTWLGGDNYQRSAAREYFAGVHRAAIMLRTKQLVTSVQSPIEEMLILRMGPILERAGVSLFDIHTQYSVCGYRLDFAILHNGRKVCVEADGHDFHERTKEQAAHDRSRDRALTLDGWIVLRFTGSEIHQDASRCACEVLRAVVAESA